MEDFNPEVQDPATTATIRAITSEKDHGLTSTLNQQLQSSYNNVVLWGHPAWLNENEKSINLTAATEWVYHNRIWMAKDKTTIAEVIGTVKGIIPYSKLASYGDFRYDLDIEAMYGNLDELDSYISDENLSINFKEILQHESEKKAQETSKEIKGILLGDYPSFSHVRQLVNHMKFESTMKIPARSNSKAINQWLSNWNAFLKSLSSVVGEEDPWTDTLLKICCRFLVAARDNQSLMLLLVAEMPFITNYRHLYTNSVPLIEMLSIPQPHLEDNPHMDTTQIDALWWKLSSGSVRKIWAKSGVRDEIEHSFEDCSNVEVGATNFLRRRLAKTKSNDCNDVEVSEEAAKSLLGSLINIIDESSNKIENSIKKVSTKKEIISTSDRPGKPLNPHKKNATDPSISSAAMNIQQKLSQYSIPKTAQPTNLLASLPNLQVPPPNLFVPPKHMADYRSFSNYTLPSSNLEMPPRDMTVHSNSAMPLPNFTIPPPNFFMPPKTMDVHPSYSALMPPNLSNLIVPPKNTTTSPITAPKQTATVLQPNFVADFQVPARPVYYMLPFAPYVQRESKYYNQYRRKQSKNNLNDLCKVQKVPEQTSISANLSLNTVSLLSGMTTKNSNQPSSGHQPIKETWQPNQGKNGIHGNVEPMKPIQPPQKLEKNNPLQIEYILKEFNRHRILQNISNKTPTTKSQVEHKTDHTSSLNCQNSENFAQPVTKECDGINSSSKINSNHPRFDKGSIQCSVDEILTKKDRKALHAVLKRNTDNGLNKLGSLIENIPIQNSTKQSSIQFNNQNKSELAIKPDVKASLRELEQLTNNNQNKYRKHCKTKSSNFSSNDALNSPRHRCNSENIEKQVPKKLSLEGQKLSQSETPMGTPFEGLNKKIQNDKQLHEETKATESMTETTTSWNFAFDENIWNEQDQYERSIQNLKDVQSQLLFDEIIDSEKVDGFTHFKVTILEILKRALLLLDSRKIKL